MLLTIRLGYLRAWLDMAALGISMGFGGNVIQPKPFTNATLSTNRFIKNQSGLVYGSPTPYVGFTTPRKYQVMFAGHAASSASTNA